MLAFLVRALLLSLAGVGPASLAQSPSAPVPTVTLHYQDRPPYSAAARDAGGHVTGLVATPAAEALAAAGIPFRWQQTPSQRQLALIQSGQGLHCGVGWFRNDERAVQGLFSAAVYRDRPYAALARDALDLPAVVDAASLMGDVRLRLLVKEGYSYGPQLDGLMARLRARTVTTSAEPALMGQMLRMGRADWMIVAPEEGAAWATDGLRMQPLSGMPEGQTRHLYCSHDLPADWLARIDAALARRDAAALR